MDGIVERNAEHIENENRYIYIYIVICYVFDSN